MNIFGNLKISKNPYQIYKGKFSAKIFLCKFVHLMHTDNNVQRVMGAVHMVIPARNYSDKHFMIDLEGDINEGQKVLVERAKRGPFKQQGGRSTVMDRSAHVTYRKRAGAFEITVRRGVISGELQQLLSKLSMHRMSTW